MDPIIRDRIAACTGRLALAMLLATCPPLLLAEGEPAPSPAVVAEPATDTEEARRQRIGWWRDARFGLFIHWGLYAIPAGEWKDKVHARGYSEWIMFKEKIPAAEYARLAERFNPVHFDPEAWAAVAKDAGMKYVVLTAKHHDGFSLFDSRATTYDSVDATPFARDIVAELSQACRKAGLRFGCYYSVDRDWYRPQGPGNRYQQTNTWDFPDSTDKDFDRYFEELAKPQVVELLSQYQPDLLWFDAIEMKSAGQVDELYRTIRKLQPACLINSRIRGCVFPTRIPPPHCDYITSGDNEILEKAPGFEWENPGSMNTSYGYNRNDHNWVDAGEIIARLADIVSKGGNYLLNVGPTAEGRFPQPCVERLREVGEWMDINAPAIRGSSPWSPGGRAKRGVAEDDNPTTDPRSEIRFTTDGRSIYAICLARPDGEVLLQELGRDRIPGKTITAVRMLGSPDKIQWRQADDGLRLSVPGELPCHHAWVYQVELH